MISEVTRDRHDDAYDEDNDVGNDHAQNGCCYKMMMMMMMMKAPTMMLCCSSMLPP